MAQSLALEELGGSEDKISYRFKVNPVERANYHGAESNDDDDDTFPEETSKIIARRSSR